MGYEGEERVEEMRERSEGEEMVWGMGGRRGV